MRCLQTLCRRIFPGSALFVLLLAWGFLLPSTATAQETNPLFTQEKVKNYLPHMTWLEVEELLTRTDIALIPVGSLEQHGKHLPLGTDFLAASEACKLVARRRRRSWWYRW